MEIRALRESDLEQAWALDHDAFRVPAERKPGFLKFAERSRWIGAFSSLYNGWASAEMLRRAGRLDGGSDAPLAALDAAFAGPTPWMLDEYQST